MAYNIRGFSQLLPGHFLKLFSHILLFKLEEVLPHHNAWRWHFLGHPTLRNTQEQVRTAAPRSNCIHLRGLYCDVTKAWRTLDYYSRYIHVSDRLLYRDEFTNSSLLIMMNLFRPAMTEVTRLSGRPVSENVALDIVMGLFISSCTCFLFCLLLYAWPAVINVRSFTSIPLYPFMAWCLGAK